MNTGLVLCCTHIPASITGTKGYDYDTMIPLQVMNRIGSDGAGQEGHGQNGHMSEEKSSPHESLAQLQVSSR